MSNTTPYSVDFAGKETIPTRGAMSGAYAELKKRAKAAGLMERTPVYYTIVFAEGLLLLGASIAILLLVDNAWVQMANAALMALAFARIGFIMHDAGHRQIFRKAGPNNAVGLFYANLLLGSSLSSWRKRHNDHHAHTNELGEDPTLEIPVWAWIEEQAQDESSGVIRLIMRYQAWTFFPVLALSSLFQAALAIRDVFFRKDGEDRLVQAIFLTLHWVWTIGVLVLSPLLWWQAIIFFFVQHFILGLHLGLVFAPNHKGMPIVDPDQPMDFLYVQCLTTRNVRPGPIIDYMYGGLNYQVEHHLFPGMPRINLGKVYSIVKAFCVEYDIPYHETGVIESYVEILTYMNEVGKSAHRLGPTVVTAE